MLTTLLILTAAGPAPRYDPTGYIATLPSGTQVRIRAVADESGAFWAPTGTPLDSGTLAQFKDEASNLHRTVQGGYVVVYYDVVPHGSKADVSFYGNFVGRNNGSHGGEAFDDHRTEGLVKHEGWSWVGGQLQSRAGMDIEVSEGPFKRVAESKRVGTSFRRVFGENLRPKFEKVKVWVQVVGGGHYSWLKELKCRDLSIDDEKFQIRHQAFNRRGKVLAEELVGGAVVMYFGPPDEPPAQEVARVEAQIRPRTVLHFKGIQLKPTMNKSELKSCNNAETGRRGLDSGNFGYRRSSELQNPPHSGA